MIRVVIHTNIFVSALLRADGLPEQVLVLAVAGGIVQLCVSADIYAEYGKRQSKHGLTNVRC